MNALCDSLEIDLFAEKRNVHLEKYMSWKPDPFAMGTDVFLANWGSMKDYALTILPETEMYSKSSEREGRFGHYDTSMANTTVLSNVTEHVDCRSKYVTTRKDLLLSLGGSIF